MRVILTPNAPQPIGPYSQAIEANGMIFCSGQIPISTQTGEVLAHDIENQTHQVMKNLQAVLEHAGVNLSHVVKTTIFLQSFNDFPIVNEIYAQYIAAAKGANPARSTVEVSRLPKDVLIEIEAIAIK